MTSLSAPVLDIARSLSARTSWVEVRWRGGACLVQTCRDLISVTPNTMVLVSDGRRERPAGAVVERASQAARWLGGIVLIAARTGRGRLLPISAPGFGSTRVARVTAEPEPGHLDWTGLAVAPARTLIAELDLEAGPDLCDALSRAGARDRLWLVD